MLKKDDVGLIRPTPAPVRRQPEQGVPQSPAMPERYSEMWTDALAVLKRRKWLVALVFVTTVMASYGLVQSITETYEAKAHLLVKLGRENVEVHGAVEKGGVVSMGVRKEEINSSVLLLSSLDLLAETVDEIGVAAFQPQRREATTLLERIKLAAKETVRGVRTLIGEVMIALRLSQRLDEREKVILGVESAMKIYREGESDVISVVLRLPDPDLAVRVVDTHIRRYLERHVSVRRQGGLFGLFEEQSAVYAKKLDELEGERQRTRAELSLSSIDEERRLLLSRLHELKRLAEVAARERDMIAKGQPPADGSLAAKPSIQPLLDRIAVLQIEKAKLLRDYDVDSRQVADVGKEIASVEAMMLARADAEVGTLQRQATVIDERLAAINEGERRLVRIEREYEIAKRHYLTYSQRLEDTRIASELDTLRVANVSVLSRPTHPIQPAYPPRAQVMLASIPVGLLLGLAFAFLLEYLNDSVRSARDLEKLPGVSFLGSFSRKRARP